MHQLLQQAALRHRRGREPMRVLGKRVEDVKAKWKGQTISGLGWIKSSQGDRANVLSSALRRGGLS